MRNHDDLEFAREYVALVRAERRGPFLSNDIDGDAALRDCAMTLADELSDEILDGFGIGRDARDVPLATSAQLAMVAQWVSNSLRSAASARPRRRPDRTWDERVRRQSHRAANSTPVMTANMVRIQDCAGLTIEIARSCIDPGAALHDRVTVQVVTASNTEVMIMNGGKAIRLPTALVVGNAGVVAAQRERGGGAARARSASESGPSRATISDNYATTGFCGDSDAY